MLMASSEVEMSSCQTINCVLNPNERCTRADHNNKKKNNNNVRNINVGFEKNLNVFVRDNLEDCTVDSTKAVPECCTSNKSSVSESRHEVPSSSSSSSSQGSDPDPNSSNPGQPGNPSRKETRAASSLVQIWEARTTQQPPSSSQNQSQIDSRASSSGSNTLLENSESLNEESLKESDLIHQTIQEGSSEEKEEEEEMECDTQFVPPPPLPDSGEKEKEGVRVMDIIRKLSSDSETTTNIDNGSSSNDNGKEVQTTEVRCFPQVTCVPRIRGRQAYTDLLEQIIRDRKDELAGILRSHSVSKFTHRGRIQSVLKIRCYERCIAIQDSHRCKPSSSGVTDLNRSGSGVMHLLREKYKTNSENIETGALSSTVSSWSRILDKDPNKAAEKTMEKSDLKGTHQEVNSAVDNAKKAVLSEIAENKNGLKKFVGGTIQKETLEGRGEKQETKAKATSKETLGGKGEKRDTKEKSVAKETPQGKDERQETKGKAISKESLEGRGEKRETKEKGMAKESLEGKGESQETKEKAVAKQSLEGRGEMREMKEKAIAKESLQGKGEKRETKEKAIAKESLEGRGEMREMKEKSIPKESLEGRGEKQETKEKTVGKDTLEGRDEHRETKEKDIAKESLEGRGDKQETKEKTIAKVSPEVRGGRRRKKEKAFEKKSVDWDNVMGIAEKVNLWSSDEKVNRRKDMDKDKTEDKAKTETVEKMGALEEASRRISSEESVERSNTASKETVPRCVFGDKLVRRKEKEDPQEEDMSREIQDTKNNPQEVTSKAEEKVLQERAAKSDLKNPASKESREERQQADGSIEGNPMMGIAEKVNLWNAKEDKNRRRVMERGRGKPEGKAQTGTNEMLQEASRRMTHVETAERSITTSKELAEKVVGTEEMTDKRESSKETRQCEFGEKGRRKKEEDIASVEAKSKKIVEDKNINPQESKSHGSREKAQEKNSSQLGDEMSILRNSELKCSKEIDRNRSKEVTKEESTSDGSREKAKEKNSSQQDEKMITLRHPNDENSIKELENEKTKEVEGEEKEDNVEEAAMEFDDGWDENELEEEEEDEWDYDIYIGENTYDWINDIARPRSYWEDLRKERYLEVLNTKSEKKDICDLIESRTVSNFLTSELRQKIDNLMITRVQGHLTVPINHEEEKDEEEDEGEEDEEDEGSARNQEEDETEEEQEKMNLETASEGCSQSSPRSCTMMMSWSFRDQDIVMDHEPTTSLALPEPSVPTNQSETQMISDLRRQMEQLQREMLELRNSFKSCIDMQLHFQKSVTQDLSLSGGSSAEQGVETRKDPLNRKCCVCSKMPVDSLLYRCGHMCTCLKCAHELQWSSKKCPICMAPIVDVVRAFLDS